MYIVGLDSPHCHHIASKLVSCIQALLVQEISTCKGAFDHHSCYLSIKGFTSLQMLLPLHIFQSLNSSSLHMPQRSSNSNRPQRHYYTNSFTRRFTSGLRGGWSGCLPRLFEVGLLKSSPKEQPDMDKQRVVEDSSKSSRSTEQRGQQ